MKTNQATRWWDFPAAALLLVALLSAATRLVVTGWTPNLALAQNLAFFGVIAGLALGQSRFSPRLAGLLAILYGFFAVPWQLGGTMSVSIPWMERIQSLAGRLEVIINQLINREVVQDSLLFVVLMSILFWALSAYAGYTLTRYGNAWRAALPAGLSLFVIHSFDMLVSRRAWYLAVYLFFTLVLVARTTYLHQHIRWQESRTALPPHLGLDFIRFTLLATGLLVTFAWTAPALANTLPAAARLYQEHIRDPWNAVRDRFDNAFASLRSSVGVVSDYYGSSLVLGRGNQLTDSLVFTARPPADLPSNARLYWMARTYDRYQGGQWRSSANRSSPFNPQTDKIDPGNWQGRFTGTFEIQTGSTLSTLFAPSQALWVSRTANADLLTNPDGTLDLSSLRASQVINAGEVYDVIASLPNYTASQLRAAGTDYPDWVKQRYLQLPDTITDRTRLLAQDITQGLQTPYDKAIAITNYLRQNIQYNATVPEVPSRQDPVDWFLFDLRQGFCNYYASAEVVLLRSIGIPARWSVGYAQGERLEDSTYVVRQRDAHAWPEVFFPNLGWVEFEPTASQPLLVFLPGDSQSGDPLSDLPPNNDLEQQRQFEEELALLRERQGRETPFQLPESTPVWQRILTVAAPLTLGLAILAFVTWRSGWHRKLKPLPVIMETSIQRLGFRPPERLHRWAQRSLLPPLTKAYLEINKALKRLGSPPAVTATPYERAENLTLILPPSQPYSEELVSEYQRVIFSAGGNNGSDASRARQSAAHIRRLSYSEMLRRLLRRLLASAQRSPRQVAQWRPRRQR